MDVDISAHSSLFVGEADTDPGRITLSTTAVAAHGIWLPYDSERFTVGVGAGGGALFYDASGVGAGPYIGRNAAGAVGMGSARVRVLARTAELSFLLAVEPGVTLPAISADDAEDAEIFRFGQPILLLQCGLGWSR
jgi:hypothetical protein